MTFCEIIVYNYWIFSTQINMWWLIWTQLEKIWQQTESSSRGIWTHLWLKQISGSIPGPVPDIYHIPCPECLQVLGSLRGSLGKTLNSSVVILSTTLNACGAIEEMILWVLLQFAPLHSWFSFLVVPDLLCS